MTTSCRERSNHYRIPYCKGCGEDRPSVEPATGAVTTAGAGADAGVDPEAGADADADAGFGDGAGAGAGAGAVAGAVVPDGAETPAATEAPAALTPAAETPSAAESPPAETVADAGEAAGTATPSAGNAFLTRILRVSNSAISTGATGWQAGQSICASYMADPDQARCFSQMNAGGGFMSVNGTDVSVGWFLIFYRPESKTALLKFAKLNKDGKGLGGFSSVVTQQTFFAKEFNITGHILFHSENTQCCITNFSFAGRYTISVDMLRSAQASVETSLRSPAAKSVASVGISGLAMLGLAPSSSSRGVVCGNPDCEGSSAKLSSQCSKCHTEFHGHCAPTGKHIGNDYYCKSECFPVVLAPRVKRVTAKRVSDKPAAENPALIAARKKAERLEEENIKLRTDAKAAQKGSATSQTIKSTSVPMGPPLAPVDHSSLQISFVNDLLGRFAEIVKEGHRHGEVIHEKTTNSQRNVTITPAEPQPEPHLLVSLSPSDQLIDNKRKLVEMQQTVDAGMKAEKAEKTRKRQAKAAEFQAQAAEAARRSQELAEQAAAQLLDSESESDNSL